MPSDAAAGQMSTRSKVHDRTTTVRGPIMKLASPCQHNAHRADRQGHRARGWRLPLTHSTHSPRPARFPGACAKVAGVGQLLQLGLLAGGLTILLAVTARWDRTLPGS